MKLSVPIDNKNAVRLRRNIRLSYGARFSARLIRKQQVHDCMVNAIDRILMQCDRSRIRGIGVTGQMHTLVVLDGGKVCAARQEWNDIRTRTNEG